MTDGLVMLDLRAIEFLMNIYDVEHDERKNVLERIQFYHDNLYTKEPKTA